MLCVMSHCNLLLLQVPDITWSRLVIPISVGQTLNFGSDGGRLSSATLLCLKEINTAFLYVDVVAGATTYLDSTFVDQKRMKDPGARPL